MGKSFNDDVFNNGFNLDSINGLNISQEAIEENKNAFTDIEKGLKEKFSNLDIDKVKEEIRASKDKEKDQEEITRLQDEIARLKEKEQQRDNKEETEQQKDPYVKKTMIFKQEYLDIINGVSAITNTEIKGTLNKILELGINEMRKENNDLIDKALKNSKKKKQDKAKDLIF